MSNVSKNYDNQFTANFRDNCLLGAYTHGLMRYFPVSNSHNGLIYKIKGIFYSLIQFCTKSGHTIRECNEEKSTKYFRLLSLLIVIATVFTLVNHFLQICFTATENASKKKLFNFEKYEEASSLHYSIVSLLIIPLPAMGFYYSFKRKGNTFVEPQFFDTISKYKPVFLRVRS